MTHTDDELREAQIAIGRVLPHINDRDMPAIFGAAVLDAVLPEHDQQLLDGVLTLIEDCTDLEDAVATVGNLIARAAAVEQETPNA